MQQDHGPKDDISSNTVQSHQAEDGFTVTDEEIEQALQRLSAMVAGDGMSDVWADELVRESTEVMDGKQEEVGHTIGGETSREIIAEMNQGSVRPYKSDVTRTTLVDASEAAHAAQIAHGKTKKRGKHKGNQRVQRRRRWAWTAAAAVVVVGTLMSPLGGKAMAAAMQTFYFHNVVGVGQNDLSQIQQALQSATGVSSGQNIDLKQYGSVSVSGDNTGYQNNLTVDEATKLVGFPIAKLPGFDATSDVLSYSPPRTVTFRLNTGAINALIMRLGGKTPLPGTVNGEPITVVVPAQVFENVSAKKNANNNMSLTEMKMPTVQVPGNVDLNQVKQALLDLPFLPGDIRNSLATSANWQDTLYVPVGGKVTNTTVNGYQAVLQNYGNGQQRSILWLENGVLYELSGSPTAFPTDTSILAVAKGLSQ